MQDTQDSKDYRMIKIAKVGIKNVKHPIIYADHPLQKQNFPSVALFSFFVELPENKKGTHMSRFPVLLYEFAPHFTLQKFQELALAINQKLESQVSYLEANFPYFYEKYAPVSNSKGLADVQIDLKVTGYAQTNSADTELSITIPVKSLCPCSKAISEYGAHSQRSYLNITVWNPQLSIQNYIEIAESSASAAVYPILKRIDEKFITEQAYNNPRFVEDLVREAAIKLKEKNSATRFTVSAENFESIHNHNAWAFVDSERLV
jgi:GTP cyclohydrolase I